MYKFISIAALALSLQSCVAGFEMAAAGAVACPDSRHCQKECGTKHCHKMMAHH